MIMKEGKTVQISDQFCCMLHPTGGVFKTGKMNKANPNCVELFSLDGKRKGWMDERLIEPFDGDAYDIWLCSNCEVNVSNNIIKPEQVTDVIYEMRCLPCDLKYRYGKTMGQAMLKGLFEYNKKEMLKKGIKYM